MAVTMTLSDVLNNTATAIVAAPVAIAMAETLDASPDPFLMAVAVAASAAFLTRSGTRTTRWCWARAAIGSAITGGWGCRWSC